MSVRKEALRGSIDGKVADYIDEVEKVQNAEIIHRDAERRRDYETLKKDIAELREIVENLNLTVETTPEMDDKYALTKAKLIRLMKDMGYYD